MASDRRFGIEIECYFPDPHDTGPCGDSYCEEYGCECGDGDFGRVRDLFHGAGLSEWAEGYIHYDGSGCEIPSPVLQGKKGLDQIRRVMDLLQGAGAHTTQSDGLHVHHEAYDFRDKDNMVRLAKTWQANNHLIRSFVERDRRNSVWCREVWNDKTISLLELDEGETVPPELESMVRPYVYAPPYNEPLKVPNEERKLYCSSGADLNCSHLYDDSHPTIEVRLHEGTLDADETIAWVEFTQRLLDEVIARKRPIKCEDSPALLLRRVKATKRMKRQLLRKAELNAA